LINKLSVDYSIKCFNHTKNFKIVDNVQYNHFSQVINTTFSESEIFLIQRFLPDVRGEIYQKIKNHKIFIWMHDLPHLNNFLFSLVQHDKDVFSSHFELFKKEILNEYLNNKNIQFIFVSNHAKNIFVEFWNRYSISFEDKRLNVIHNILCEDEFLEIKNLSVEKNVNQLVYASAWQKGLPDVIKLFENLLIHDDKLKLVLLSPGYDYRHWKDYENDIKQKFGNKIIVHGPVNKLQLAKIIKESICLLSPKFNETFGCVFAESCYLGTHVIYDYRSGAVKEFVCEKNRVDIDDHHKVYSLIKEFQHNPYERCTLHETFMLDYNLQKWKELLCVKYL